MSLAKDWSEDWKYIAKGELDSLRSSRPPADYLGFIKKGYPPVILVPGITRKWGFLKSLADKISRTGYPVYAVPELGRNVIPIPRAARIIEQLLASQNIKGGILLGHSKGGLIAKYILAHSPERGRVRAVIAIATPFYGSKMARLALSRAYQEITPESKIIRELALHKSINRKIYSIIPIYDNLLPQHSSYLPGAHNLIVYSRGHHTILFEPKTIRLILGILTGLRRK
ncbi:MAG: hypothetical protein V1856_02500 [Candidatus Liptonbacteria bacterium]